MPAFGWILKDDQIADVLTYIRNTPVTASQVRNERQALTERSD
jgi:mono/diheme cytochrome c family protein